MKFLKQVKGWDIIKEVQKGNGQQFSVNSNQ